MVNPTFDIPSLLPNKDLGHGPGPLPSNNRDDEIAVMRFRFNKAAITAIASPGKPVSGVRIVSAVITKALIRLDRARHGRGRDFVISQPVNLRGRTVPPQPRHACGNFVISAVTRRVAAAEEGAVGVKELVELIGDSVRRCIGDYSGVLSRDRDGRGMILSGVASYAEEVFRGDTNAVVFSDWSRFGFYEADFGWGKPVLASVGPQWLPSMYSNIVVLMSDREGVGIEAWVMLSQDDMRCFEKDEDIILFQLDDD